MAANMRKVQTEIILFRLPLECTVHSFGRGLIGHFWLYFSDFKPDLYNMKPLSLKFQVTAGYFQNEITFDSFAESE